MTPKTSEELWAAYISQNPHWLTDNVTLTPKGIKALVMRTFEHGYNAGTVQNTHQNPGNPYESDVVKSLNDLFTKAKKI